MVAKQFSAYMLIYEREFVLPNPAPSVKSVVPGRDERSTAAQAEESSVGGVAPSPDSSANSARLSNKDASHGGEGKVASSSAVGQENKVGVKAEEVQLTVAARTVGVHGSEGRGGVGKTPDEKEWEPPWSGVPSPADLVPSSVFQVSSVLFSPLAYRCRAASISGSVNMAESSPAEIVGCTGVDSARTLCR